MELGRCLRIFSKRQPVDRPTEWRKGYKIGRETGREALRQIAIMHTHPIECRCLDCLLIRDIRNTT